MKKKHPANYIGAGYNRAPYDFYETPPEAVEMLMEVEEFPEEWEYWEPAAGRGSISRVLESHGLKVISSDIRDTDDVYGMRGVDFLNANYQVDCIITNPPFSLAENFVIRAHELARHKIVMLLRLAFLEGNKRRKIWAWRTLTKVYVFSNRVKICNPYNPIKSNNMMAMGWFVWEKDKKGSEPVIKWLPKLEMPNEFFL